MNEIEKSELPPSSFSHSTLLMHGLRGLFLSGAETAIAFETPATLEEFSSECGMRFGRGVLLDEFRAGWNGARGANKHHITDKGA
jgi:hypothetical protein